MPYHGRHAVARYGAVAVVDPVFDHFDPCLEFIRKAASWRAWIAQFIGDGRLLGLEATWRAGIAYSFSAPG